jgi:NitT/TauT family transport system permease protein
MTPWQRILAALAGLSAAGAALLCLPQIGTHGLMLTVGIFGAASLGRFIIPLTYWIDGWLAGLGAIAIVLGLVDVSAALWLSLVAAWLFAWLFIDRMANALAAGELRLPGAGLVVPLVFGATLLVIWEVLVRGLNVPVILLPAPSGIWSRLVVAFNDGTLWADFRQTFLKSVLAGYAIGCVAGFAIAILVDRSPSLKRGLLPIGNFVSALPIIGIAPIMVMWFGFDWQSKAAVIVCITVFPMLVNTVAGLNAAGRMERDMMRTYASSYWQTLFKLRLPAAAPFIFNALKINSTLALIGAIVAEFFGTPIVGMGFRIATEVGRLNADMVWAEVAVAAVAGSASYGLIALLERAVTFWHPSVRGGRA